MQVKEFGEWATSRIAGGERDPKELTDGYIEYLAGCVDRENRLRELKRQRATASAEIDQLESEARQGAHYLNTLRVDPGSRLSDVAAQFQRLEQIDGAHS